MPSNAPPQQSWNTSTAVAGDPGAGTRRDNFQDLFRGWNKTNHNNNDDAYCRERHTTGEENIQASRSSTDVNQGDMHSSNRVPTTETAAQQRRADLRVGFVSLPPPPRPPGSAPAPGDEFSLSSTEFLHPASDERVVSLSARSLSAPLSPPPQSRPGDESARYMGSRLKNLGKTVLQPLRDLQLAEKLNAMNIDAEVLRKLNLHDREEREHTSRGELEEMERMKHEAEKACQRVSMRYDSLVRFVKQHPRGNYAEFIEFLFKEGSKRNDAEYDGGDAPLSEDHYQLFFCENFYDKDSEYRKLWNDNLALGLPDGASTVERRSFIPVEASFYADQKHRFENNNDGCAPAFREQIRQRTLSEGERIKKIASQADGRRLRKFGSAVSSMALRPLRDLQLAEKINAMNLDAEDEEVRRAIAAQRHREEEARQEEEMMKMKREAEESCLMATREHLTNFILDRPNSTYHEWIEDLHPENAHDGTLLEGLGKTIDHRFFLEDSDHRILWNDFLASGSSGRAYVPARVSQVDGQGEWVRAEDLLSNF